MNTTRLYVIFFLFSIQSAYAQIPPATWQEHWFEHNQLLNRVYYDNDVAIYHDNDVNPATTWMNGFSGDIWRYVKRVYGNFGAENRLYAIFHTGKYGGGHPSTYFDASHDYRNVIDIGTGGNWDCKCGWNIDVISHEIAHIVELSSKGVHGSPAFGLWGDSKWAEIFNYDIYVNLGMTEEVTRTYNTLINSSDNFPRAGTYWFRDWFYPIYSNHGGAATLNRYFELLAQYFPKNGNNYSRGMNWGEFVHFWSGAAGTDLKALATTAFGWTSQYEAQFNQAKTQFPFSYDIGVTVYEDCNFRGYGVALKAGSYNLSDLQAKGIGNDKISSIKVPSGYQIVIYDHINFGGSSFTITSNNTCLVDEGFNDRVTSLVVSKINSAQSPQSEPQVDAAARLQNILSVTGAQQSVTAHIAQCKFHEAGVDQTPEGNIGVYPNPTASELHLQLPPAWAASQVTILDEDGHAVRTQLYNEVLDIKDLRPGIYSIVIRKEKDQIIRRFIKK